ncbi:MAG: bifunctional phosphoribosylaminoimidazolecarboxamide formyltransferase/IMP cyclohydrolase [Bacilli bacterium]
MTRALMSVSDKSGIVDLAKVLVAAGVEIVSTGGTYRTLRDAGVAVQEVANVTEFPEMMDGRVKTLHPKIHGGLLALRDNAEHMRVAQEHGIGMIDYVVVNLYPFAQTIAKPGVTVAEAIENIDIGGPAMLRSAAKNYRHVVVLTDPDDYGWIAQRVQAGSPVTEEERFRLAAKVFRHSAAYDARIADYLTRLTGEQFADSLTLTFSRVQTLRYGENPHQQAAFYRSSLAPPQPSLVGARQLQGKELSYNNIQDADAALALLLEFAEPAAVAVKHMNPCGVGVAKTVNEAFARAYAADPVSIFGGIVACNREVDEELAGRLTEFFLEIVMAPSFSDGALATLAKKKNVRVLALGDFAASGSSGASGASAIKSVSGGLLAQDQDRRTVVEDELQVVTQRAPSKEELADLLFAWKVVKHVKSNAIVLAKDGQTVGVGAGQMNRVGAARIAAEQAGERAVGCVLASDAFFPLPDTVEVAALAGVRAIIQPGGSIKDKLSIAAADEHGIAMVFTGVRHFRH